MFVALAYPCRPPSEPLNRVFAAQRHITSGLSPPLRRRKRRDLSRDYVLVSRALARLPVSGSRAGSINLQPTLTATRLDAIRGGASAPRDLGSCSRCFTSTTRGAPMSGAYEGRQIVGMDLHRRRSVLVRMTETGQHDALPDAAQNRRTGRRERSTNKNSGLTGPAPSEMTVGIYIHTYVRYISGDVQLAATAPWHCLRIRRLGFESPPGAPRRSSGRASSLSTSF